MSPIFDISFTYRAELEVDDIIQSSCVNNSISPLHDILIAKKGVAAHFARILIQVLNSVATIMVDCLATTNLALRN